MRLAWSSSSATTLPPGLTAATIRRIAGQCLKRVDLGRRLRLLGVRVGKLAKAGSIAAPAAAAAPHRVAEQTIDLFAE